jgi:hypothetical protein
MLGKRIAAKAAPTVRSRAQELLRWACSAVCFSQTKTGCSA